MLKCILINNIIVFGSLNTYAENDQLWKNMRLLERENQILCDMSKNDMTMLNVERKEINDYTDKDSNSTMWIRWIVNNELIIG